MVYLYSRTMTCLDARTTAIILSVTKAGYGNGLVTEEGMHLAIESVIGTSFNSQRLKVVSSEVQISEG